MTSRSPDAADAKVRGTQAAGGWSGADTATVAALGVVMVLVFVGLWHLGRSNVFFYDEWDFVTQRRSGGAESLLRSHNGHLYGVTAGLYRVLFATLGLGHYGAFRVMVTMAHLLCGGLLFAYARQRLGGPVAFLVAVALLGYGQAWENLIWPFQTGLFVSVAAFFATVMLLDRRRVAGDVGAACALGVGLASFSFGIAAVAGMAAELVVRRDWKRMWVVALPMAAYLLWYRAFGGNPMPLSKPEDIPEFMATAAGAAVGGLFGVASPEQGKLVLLLVAAVTVAALVWGRMDRPRVLLVVVTLGAYWGSVALTRATWIPESAASPRYVYPAAATVLVLLVEHAKHMPARVPAVVFLAGCVALACWSHVDDLRAGAAGRRDLSMTVRAELAALELVGPGRIVDPNFRPDTNLMPQVAAGPYLAAVEELGSPVNVLAELRRGREGDRLAADAVMVAALGVHLEPAPPDLAVGCRPSGEVVSGSGRDVVMRREELGIIAERGPVEVRIRRFGPLPNTAFAQVQEGSPALLRIPADRGPDVWRVNFRTTGSALICRLGG